MAKDRNRKPQRGRKEDTREEKKILQNRALLNFSFKYLDQSQPSKAPQTLKLWENKQLLGKFCQRLVELSKLTPSMLITSFSNTWTLVPLESCFSSPINLG